MSAPTGPICILGMPRSGTTWLAKLFDSHPDTLYRHEPDSAGALHPIPLLAAPDREAEDLVVMRAFLAGLRQRRTARICGKLPLFPKASMPGWRGRVQRASIYAARLTPRALRLPVLEPVHPGRPAPRVVWKSIESTGRAGLIARADPRGRLLLVIRHPCGQIHSTLRGEGRNHFAETTATADDWGVFERLLATPQARRHGLTRQRLEQASAPERLAWRWLLFNEKAVAELAERSNARICLYEDLCARPAAVARTLFDFAGLPWAREVDAFLAASTAVDDARYYSLLRDPRRAASAWREHLPSAVRARILDVVDGSAPGRLCLQAAPEPEPALVERAEPRA